MSNKAWNQNDMDKNWIHGRGWNGVVNEFLTISLPTSVGVPPNKCSLYLVCITGIFWFGKNTNYYTS